MAMNSLFPDGWFALGAAALKLLSTMVPNCFKDLNNLQIIRMDVAQVSDHVLQIIASACKLLVDIGFSKWKGVTDFGISQLVLGCFRLKILDLTCCDEDT